MGKSEVIVPEIMLEDQLNHIMQDLNYRLSYQGIQLQDYANYMGTTVEALREDRREDARHICQIKLMLEAIIKKEKMKVTEKEFNSEIEEIAKMQNISTEDAKKGLDSRRIERINSDILMRKLLKFLTENNTVVAKAKGAKKAKTETKKAEAKTTDTKSTAKKTSTKSASTKAAATKKSCAKTVKKDEK